MIYHYICNKCGTKKDENFPMGQARQRIMCRCGGNMIQDILAKKIQTHLSEDYIATSEYHTVDYGGSDEDMEKMLNFRS